MRPIAFQLLVVGLACVTFLSGELSAQQATVTTPYQSVSDGFFENIGTSWGLSGNNWFFSFGGSPTQAAPPFGGFDPSAGANFGFGFRGGGAGGYFNANWAQGCRRSFVTQAPSVTLQNGMPAFLSDTSQSPFVISYIPVVGAFPAVMNCRPALPPTANVMPSPGASGVGHDAVMNALRSARSGRDRQQQVQHDPPAQPKAAGPNQAGAAPADLALVGGSSPAGGAVDGASDEASRRLAAARASSAGRPAPSVAEARQLHAAEQAAQNQEAQLWLERARHAEAVGKPNVAKVYYQMAAKRAAAPMRTEILARIEALASGSTSQ